MAVNLQLASQNGQVKLGKTHEWESYNFNALGYLPFDNVASVGAGVANTVIQARLVLPQASKIAKVAVYCSAIDNVDGTDFFNIVMGTGAYTNSTLGPIDDSQQWGYPTLLAVNGDAMFSGDALFNVTNFPNLATGTGGSSVLVPTIYDCVYPEGAVLTLRTHTVASTGSITNLKVVLLLEPIDTLISDAAAIPNTDW